MSADVRAAALAAIAHARLVLDDAEYAVGQGYPLAQVAAELRADADRLAR
jgi:hypothetical protein